MADILSELQTSALYQLREAGKLKRPQELLVNNEREILAILSQLRDYTLQAPADKKMLANRYRTHLNELIATLPILSHSRENYFSTDSNNPQQIEHTLSKLNSETTRLSELPRLEIYSEAEDDGLQNLLSNASASQEDNKDEVGNLSLQELASLIRCYSKELRNIQRLYVQKDVATENATQLPKRLNQHLAENQILIEQQYSNTKTRVYVSLIIGSSSITGERLLNLQAGVFFSQADPTPRRD